MQTYQELVKHVGEVCEEVGGELVYCVIVGSRLYGVETESSDYDIRFVFKPYTNIPKGNNLFKFSQSDNIEEKVEFRGMKCEIKGWALQTWLLKHLHAGNTEGVDCLFSYFQQKQENILYCDSRMKMIFENYEKLFYPLKTDSFKGMANQQALKYGIKANRLQDLLKIQEVVKNANPDDRLEQYFDMILQESYHSEYCFEMKDRVRNDIRVLKLADKEHHSSIYISEFQRRLSETISGMSNRVKENVELGRQDWKSLSHAIRVLDEIQEVLQTGRISFPVKRIDYIRSIKQGEVDYVNVKEEIERMFKFTSDLREDEVKNRRLKGEYDRQFAEQCILELYNN